MRENLLVSVIVPTFDRAHYLRACLDSLLAQTVQPAEIIVVDDGSRDDTAAVVTACGGRVRYLWQQNSGKSAALNHGMGQACGEAFWFFDDDDLALPDSLERRLRALERQPEAEFVYSDGYVATERRDGSLRILRRARACPAGEELLLEVMRSFSFFQQSMLIRRSCVARAGAFDTRYLRCQDYEFIIRVVRACRGAYLPHPTFIQREHRGARGPMLLRHGPEERVATWLRFNRMLAEQLSATMTLGEFLVPPRSTNELSAGERRAALLNRITVYATKGHVGLVAADLERLGELAAAGPCPALSATEIRCLVRSAGHKHFRLALRQGASLAAPFIPHGPTPTARILREIAACFALALANPRGYVRPGNTERLALAASFIELAALARSTIPRVALRALAMRAGR